MKMINPQTREPEDVEDFLTAIEQGWGLPSRNIVQDQEGNQRVRLVREGERFTVPLNQLHPFIKQTPGVRLTTEEDDLIADDQPIIPGAEGLLAGASVATAGASDLFMWPLTLLGRSKSGMASQYLGQLSGLSLGGADAVSAMMNPELHQALMEQHGGAHLGGEFGATLASTLASGGTTLGAKGLSLGGKEAVRAGAKIIGKEAAVAGKTAYSGAMTGKAAQIAASLAPTRVVTNWSNRIGARFIGEFAGKNAAGPITTAIMHAGARTGTFAGLSGAEGALWGLSQVLEERALGNPKELGDILASAGASAIIGGGIGLGGSLLSATVGQTAQRASKRVAQMAASDRLQRLGKAAAEENLMTEFNLSRSQLQQALRRRDVFGYLFDEDIMPEVLNGSILKKRLADGTEVLVDDAEAYNRMSAVFDEARMTVETERGNVQNQIQQLGIKDKARSLWNQWKAAEAELASAKEGTPEYVAAFTNAKQAEELFKEAVEASPLVGGHEVRAIIQGMIDELPVGPAASPKAKALKTVRDELGKIPFFDWRTVDEIKGAGDDVRSVFNKSIWIERKSLQESFRKIAKTPNADIPSQDRGDAFRDAYRELNKAMWPKVETAGGLVDAWQKANSIFYNLGELKHVTEEVIGMKGGILKEIGHMWRRFAEITGWKVSTAAAISATRGLQGVTSKGLLGSVGGAAGWFIGGGFPGAVAGAAGGVVLASGLRAAVKPMQFKVAEIGRKIAVNHHLLKPANDFSEAIDRLVKTWMSRSTARSVVTPIIGREVVRTLGRHRDDRRAAANIRGRVNTMMANPQKFAMHMQQHVGPIQHSHPETAAAYQ